MKFAPIATVALVFAGVLLVAQSCQEKPGALQPATPAPASAQDQPQAAPQVPAPAPAQEFNQHTVETAITAISFQVSPERLDRLRSDRAANPRLRKACYWLEAARRAGSESLDTIKAVQIKNGSHGTERAKLVEKSLIRNLKILRSLGCLDGAGMAKLRKSNAPVITRGPYAGELATVDHIIPRSVCLELDNRIYNLEFMPDTVNNRKGAKIGQRQVQEARKWHGLGLLSDEGLETVEEARAKR